MIGDDVAVRTDYIAGAGLRARLGRFRVRGVRFRRCLRRAEIAGAVDPASLDGADATGERGQ